MKPYFSEEAKDLLTRLLQNNVNNIQKQPYYITNISLFSD